MTNSANISVNVTANTGGLESGFKKAQQAVTGATEAIGNSIAGMGAKTEAIAKLTSSQLYKVRQALDAVKTPTERFAEAQRLYNAALEQGRIKQDQYNKLIAQARKGTIDVTSVFSRAGSTALHLAGYMGQTVSTIGAAVAGMQRFGVILGGGILGVAMVRGFRSAADFAGTLKDVAESAGISAESLQELRYAAAQVGVSTEDTDMAMTKFSVNVGKAAGGVKESMASFAKIGISENDVKTKSTEQLLNMVAKRMGEVTDASQRAAIAVTLFGKGGAGMSRVFAEGEEGLRRMREQAQQLGMVLSDEMVSAADDAGDRMDSLGNILKTKVLTILLQLTPVIDFATRAFFMLADGIAAAFGDPDLLKGPEQLTQDINALWKELTRLKTTAWAGGGEYDPAKDKAIAQKAKEVEAQIIKLNALRDKINARTAPKTSTKLIDTDQIEKDRKKMEDEGAQMAKAMRTPAQELAHLKDLLAGGFIDADTYASQVTKVKLSVKGVSDIEKYNIDLAQLNKEFADGSSNAEQFARDKADLDAKFAGGALGAAIGAQQEYNDTVAEANLLRANGTINEAQYALRVSDATDAMNKARSEATLFGKIATEIGDGFGDAFGEIVTGSAKASDAIRALGVQIVKSIFSQTVGKAVGQAVTSGIGMLGFAEGGQPPVGKVSMVGENGPELFLPKGAGTIIPNNQLGGSSGGGGPTIYADMRGASVEAVQRLEAFVQNINGSLESRSVAAVVNANQRNPKLLRG